MKILTTLPFIFVANSSFALQGPCEKQAVSVVEYIERLENPLLKKNERLFFSQRTTYSTTHLTTVVVQVRFNDRSTALYELIFNEFGGECAGLNTLRRATGK